MDTQPTDGNAIQKVPCLGCGADLRFAPGTQHLECPYCGMEAEISPSGGSIEELDFHAFLARAEDQATTVEVLTVSCQACNAKTTLENNVTGSLCPFCGTALLAQAESTRLIQPRSVLPFAIEQGDADQRLQQWLNGLWFAPSKLKKYARRHGLDGVYVPYWTYDCGATTGYSGQRGEYYFTTESFSAKDSQGNPVTRTRRKRNIRWHGAAGTVRNRFDDVIVLGSGTLPQKYLDDLTPWDLENLVPYDPRYLTGFRVESYNIDLEKGFDRAQIKMEPMIRQTIRQDIGGDEQRISSMDREYSNITFKHTLLPIWICAYRFGDEVFRVMINARTGEVQGERPFSKAKIILTVLLVVFVIWMLVMTMGGR